MNTLNKVEPDVSTSGSMNNLRKWYNTILVNLGKDHARRAVTGLARMYLSNKEIPADEYAVKLEEETNRIQQQLSGIQCVRLI